ncbi:MAG: chromosome segregation SMC family protein [Spirochaetaceae bacterium]
MVLKSIELYGFKSFADRSRMDFGEGVSTLLGPNGCGKSNVVDAVKWVLGEQGTRSLRADRMEDVIFNGTDARKPLNVAEVTLFLENADGVLPIDFQEVAVKRRLYRSGESEYFINGSPVKLKDVRELFYDTGIGKSAYSIMEQGKIDQILSNKPEERRHVFEEAAGITKYKVRGKEAQRKLERTEENMHQVENILGEVKRNYETLRKQSEKTLRYRELKSRRFEVERDLQLLRLKSFLEEKHKKERRLNEKTTERDELKKEIDGINESLEQNLDMVNSMESELMEVQKRLYGLEAEKNNRDHQLGVSRERLEELGNKIESERKRLETLTKKAEDLIAEIERQETQIAELEKRLADVEENVNEFEQSIDTALGRIKDNDSAAAERERRIELLRAEQERLNRDIRALTEDIVTELDERLEQTGYSRGERARTAESLEDELGKLRTHIEGKHALLSDIESTGAAAGDGARLLDVLRSVQKENEASLDALAGIESLIAQYTSLMPTFLDEFLAPEGIITKKRSLDEEVVERDRRIAAAQEEIAQLRRDNDHLSGKIEEYRGTLEQLRVNRAQMQTQVSGLRDALDRSKRDRRELDAQMEGIRRDIEQDGRRKEEIRLKIGELEADKERLAEQEKELGGKLTALRESISTRNADLVSKERSLKSSMDRLGKLQNEVEKLQMSVTETTTEIRNVYDNFAERHSRDLHDYEDRIYELGATQAEQRQALSAIREEEQAIGSVNLMAPEEFEEVKERYEFLAGQLDDLRAARQDLLRVTEEIHAESTRLFLVTYEKVKKNFHTMFRRLFGGGRGELRLTDPDNVLETGVEIFAQPPGKKLENITLLSGGERSLTAVALLFATYMVRPSPFCLLDEIDAALDENNVGRFVDMLLEFSKHSQFIVITHNKKTVASAQTLLGVTMEEPGVSKLVTMRIDRRDPVYA